MPSRAIPSPAPVNLPVFYSVAPAPSTHHHDKATRIFPPLASAGVSVGFSLLITLSVCFCKFSRKRRSPAAVDSSSPPPHKAPPCEFSYSVLRRATSSFSPENRLGRGGFGSVFRGSLPPSYGGNVAVKVMDSGSLQGEREFQNELFFAGKLDSPHVVSVIGFSHDGKRRRRRLILVYELMENGNLQDALLHRRCPELMDWNRRFLLAIDIAKGIEHLHSLSPPVIHGDLKPSNILLDRFFSAKLADFGLARLKSDQVEVTVEAESDGIRLDRNGGATEEYGSVVEEVESVITNTTGYEESNLGFTDQSPVSVYKAPESVIASPETMQVPFSSPETTVQVPLTSPETAVSISPETVEKVSDLEVKRNGKEMEGKDRWWKQEGNVGKGKVKDYVTQWIGSEVKKERPSSDWITEKAAETASLSSKNLEKKKSSKRLEWWLSLDEEKKKKKRRMVREWWKDEYRKELAKRMKKKNKKKKTLESEFYSDDMSSSVDEEMYKKKRRGSSSNSIGSSIDWWLDGLSGEQWRARRKNSHDSVKSCGVSSTPSMRGTMCYVAPEYSGNNIDHVSEKCDVYSYGVLLLVLVSGRRPLEVTGTGPASEILQRANLMSWARKLARKGRLGDLVDEKLKSLEQEQAVLCIKVSLQCLQRSPVSRPSMKDVLGMLTGAVSPPELPTEFSPSPQSRFQLKTRRKQRR